MSTKTEILFTFEQWFDNDGNGRPFPCTLYTWDDGYMDLHAQTGEGHSCAISRATRMLYWQRDLKVGDPKLCGPSGIYYEVVPCTKEESESNRRWRELLVQSRECA